MPKVATQQRPSRNRPWVPGPARWAAHHATCFPPI